MNRNTVEGDLIEVSLRQLGATHVHELSSKMYHVEFQVNGVEISYLFNITRNDKFYLQRVKPYSINHARFVDTQGVVEFIKEDLKKFDSAVRSSNFPRFLQVIEKTHQFTDLLEEKFLNYNVDPKDIQNLHQQLDKIMESMDQLSQNAKDL